MATFDDYLNEELSQQLGCSFNVTAVYATTTIFDALAAEDLDFAFVDATNYACLSSQYGVVPLASIARLENVSGRLVRSKGDLRNSRGSVYKAHGVDVLTDTAEIMLANNTDDAVSDLKSGRTDAALLRADVLAHMEERGIINASFFKSLSSAVQPEYPYPVSTSLIPDNVFIAAAKVPVTTRKAVAQALYRITKDDYPAQVGSYCTWLPPYSYISMWQVLQDHGLVTANGTCSPHADLYSVISCPAQTVEAPESAMQDHCAQAGIPPCPQGYVCFCRPCIPAPAHKKAASTLAKTLGSTAFSIVVTIIVLVVVAVALLVYRLNRDFRVPVGLNLIPYQDLNLSKSSDIIGQSRHGLVLQADYRSMLVAIKMILPPARPNRSTIFTPGGSALQRVSSVEEVQQADMEMCQSLTTNSSLDHESPNSSGKRALLYPDETDPTSSFCMPGIRVLIVWQHSHFRRAIRKTLAALSSIQYALDGSRYKQAQLRQQAVLKIALSSRIMHPNIVTCQGISEHPASKDLLLVSCVQHCR
ncbi:hypothetical protein WJX77_001120 [Trebouxia sp. C0004]